MKVLVTGGAGYIGSITNRQLVESGFETVVFDNLSEGHEAAVGRTRLVKGDLTNKDDIARVFKEEKFDAVIHFAGKTLAPESMEKPYEYFYNNIVGGLNLLEAARFGNCTKIVFSSTCAVYGYPKKLPVGENTQLSPISVYGETKRMFESMLTWYGKIYSFSYISLRYFNAAGATENGELGEDHKKETHIIPAALKSAFHNTEFILYGEDYDTPDGTCFRDYIHVVDLANAHALALQKLTEKGVNAVYNLGTQKPYSNRQILEMVKKVTGKNFSIKVAPRREGDPAAIYADTKLATRELGWKPKYDDLEEIVKTAWLWYKSHPNGYSS